MLVGAATAGMCNGIAHRPRPPSRAPRHSATTAIRTRIRTAIDGPAMLLPTVALMSDPARPWMTQKSDSKRDTNPRMTGNHHQSDEQNNCCRARHSAVILTRLVLSTDSSHMILLDT